MSTQRHPGSSQVTRLKFVRTDPVFGFQRGTEWETSHGGRDYKLVKSKGEWWLYYRSQSTSGSSGWELADVRSSSGVRSSMGTRLDDAKHNTTIFLCLGQNCDHENWRD